MKSFDPQRLRMVLCFVLVALFVAAMFVTTHMHAGMGDCVAMRPGRGFLFACRTPYSLQSDFRSKLKHYCRIQFAIRVHHGALLSSVRITNTCVTASAGSAYQ